MKYCHKCGNPLEDDMLFCQKCGTKAADPVPDSGAKQCYESESKDAGSSEYPTSSRKGMQVLAIVCVLCLL